MVLILSTVIIKPNAMPKPKLVTLLNLNILVKNIVGVALILRKMAGRLCTAVLEEIVTLGEINVYLKKPIFAETIMGVNTFIAMAGILNFAAIKAVIIKWEYANN